MILLGKLRLRKSIAWPQSRYWKVAELRTVHSQSTARVPHQDSSDLKVGGGQKETDLKLVSNRLV